MKAYFINYDEMATINYSFVFALYRIAETDKAERLDNIITYKSQKELAQRIKDICGYDISVSTISRILQNTAEYYPYFSKSETENKLILHNNFKKGKAASNKFVVLNDIEISFLLEQDSKLLTKYYLYLKYYCGYTKSKEIDTTAEQILSAIGYSAASGKNKSTLYQYNSLLVEKQFITIEKIWDCKGHSRNIYRVKV